MKILSLDSSTSSASCAILQEGKLLGEITFNDKKQHSVILMSQIDSLLKNLNLSIKDIDGFVVSKGPGSFTGLRIGMATIKGLVEGTKKPFVGVSTLDALSYNLAYTPGIICPIMDALRDNLYTALYKFNGEKLERLTDYMAIHIDELISTIKEYNCESISFVGDGLIKFRSKLNESFPNVNFAPAHLNVAKAASLGELGLIRLLNEDSDNLLSFAPIYIRKSQAEREYESRTGMSIDD